MWATQNYLAEILRETFLRFYENRKKKKRIFGSG